MKQSSKKISTGTAALYCRLSRDDNMDSESNSIQNHDVMYRGWITPKKHYIMTGGSFVANEKTVMIKEGCPQTYRNCQPTFPRKEPCMELTYTKCGDYFIPDLVLSDAKEYHIGKYGRLRRAYLKEHRPILYTDLIVTEKLFPHLEEIDTACRERLEIIEKTMMQQKGVTEALKAADQMEWVRSMNSIHNRAEEIVLAELVYC